jgi:hypothetical protein
MLMLLTSLTIQTCLIDQFQINLEPETLRNCEDYDQRFQQRKNGNSNQDSGHNRRNKNCQFTDNQPEEIKAVTLAGRRLWEFHLSLDGLPLTAQNSQDRISFGDEWGSLPLGFAEAALNLLRTIGWATPPCFQKHGDHWAEVSRIPAVRQVRRRKNPVRPDVDERPNETKGRTS